MLLNGQTDSVSLLWEEYKTKGGINLRNQLVEEYWILVVWEAEKMKSRLPNFVRLEDLVSAGIFGLIEAVEKFDLAYGVAFETYSVTLIRRTIIAELRDLDWVPRGVRARVGIYKKAISELTLKNGGFLPSLEELAEYLNISVRVARNIQREIDSACFLQFDQFQLPNEKSPKPQESLSAREDFEESFAYLSEEDRVILYLYYGRGLKIKRISELLGLSEKETSFRKNRAIQRMRTKKKFRNYRRKRLQAA